MACYSNFIGVRFGTNPNPPRSGLYVDDLAGISLMGTAQITTDFEDAEGFIEREVEKACLLTIQDVLNFTPDGKAFPYMRTNALSDVYFQSDFNENVVNSSSEQGISFEMLRPDFYQHSKLLLQRVFLKANEDIEDATVKIIDGTTIIEITGVDLVANVPLELNEFNSGDNLPYKATTHKLEITVQHDSNFYKAVLPTKRECASCGGSSRSKPNTASYTDENTMLEIRGGYGVNAEMQIVCDTEKLGCSMLQTLKWAVYYKLAIELMKNGKLTERVNFYALHADFEEALRMYEFDYDKQLRTIVPNLSRLYRLQDLNCFGCGGLTKETIRV